MATAIPLKKKSASHQLSAPDKEKQNVKVVVRIRPFSKVEEDTHVKPVIKYVSSKEIVTKEKKFNFDRVFKPDVNQLEVYQTVVAPMIPDVIAGYNCTVFAYGQTGSGKTYTMTGDNCQCPSNWKEDLNAGCIPRAAAHIFEELLNTNENSVKISYLELYNEETRDLLSDDESLLGLPIYNDTKGRVFIQGLTEVSVHDSESLCEQLQKGNLKRQTAATLMNHQSSRSHTVLTITVHTREVNASGEDILKTGKLNLVDLAGSENIARSGCKDMRAIELANINKSLLTLGRVIQALADKGQRHVPYRDSKLTRILQDSLGGHTKTCIIATVSPGANAYEETVSTLEYASRARDIKNTPSINEKLTKAQVIEGLMNEIDRLRKDLEAAREKSGFFIDNENYQKLLQRVAMITGEKVTMEEVTKRQTKRIEELEEIMRTRTKEFDNAVDMCKRNKELLAEAKQVIQEKKNFVKQEQFVAQVYEMEASQLHKKAKLLLSTSKQLSAERSILQEKLEKQYKINMKNETIGQSAVSKILELLNKISNEGQKSELSEKQMRQICNADVDSLKRKLQGPFDAVKRMLKFFGTHHLHELSIRDDIDKSVDKYVDIIKERTLDMKAMLHLNNLNTNIIENNNKALCNFKRIITKYANTVHELLEKIFKILRIEEQEILTRIEMLEGDILQRKGHAQLVFQLRAKMDIKILERISTIRDQLQGRDYDRRKLEMFSDFIDETKKTENRAQAIVDDLNKKVSCQLTIAPIESASEDMLTALTKFEEEDMSVSFELHERRQNTLDASKYLDMKIEDISKILDDKVNEFNKQFNSLMDDDNTFKQLFSDYVYRIRQMLSEDILNKFICVKHGGDTPFKEHVVVPKYLQPVPPRAAVLEKFEEQTALFSDESASGSELDLIYPAEPGDSAPP